MPHPWLEIPISDYEQHMALPGIAQAQMLSKELADAVIAHRPCSIAVIGCAGGNGFDRLYSPALARVVGIDINPTYIEAVRGRYGAIIPGLELHVADIETDLANVAPVDLVFAGLIFEYVDVLQTLRNLHGLCLEASVVVVVLQLPGAQTPAVSPSPYVSLQALSPHLQLRDPASVAAIGRSLGLEKLTERRLVLPSGKAFAVLTFRRP